MNSTFASTVPALRSVDTNLTAPTVDIALNDAGLLPISALSKPITASFPAWSNVMKGISSQLLWNNHPTGPIKPIDEDTLPGDILTLEIPIGVLVEGKHALAYRLTNLENNSTSDSPSSPIEVDRTAPGAPVLAPIIFPVQIQNGLTSGELESLGNVLSGTVAGYKGMEEGDVIRTYWNNTPGPLAVVTRDDMGLKRVMVDFIRPFLEMIGDIQAPVHYTVTDLAGNLSMESERLNVALQLSVVTPLPTPKIKEANGSTLDPADALQGATVVVGASANLKAGDRVTLQWRGPLGSDTKEKSITEAEAGAVLEVVFAAALVMANAGQSVSVLYTINRANGTVQTSATLNLQIVAGLSELPAPRMDTVGADGVVVPSLIPASGATVRVTYPAMGAQDSVVVSWQGASSYHTAPQAGNGRELLFTVPKALIVANAGGSATANYTVTRAGVAKTSAPLWLKVKQELVFDTSPVKLTGKVYLIPSTPDLLPNLPAGTSVRRQATGGQAPYRYASSNPLVAKVDGNGLTTVRGNGSSLITVTDALGTSQSYTVTVTGVIHCLALGSGSFSQMTSAASGKSARIPSIHELQEIYAAYGSRWPLGNGNYWSSTVASQNLLGWKWYFVKNLVTGKDFKLLHHNASLGVAIR